MKKIIKTLLIATILVATIITTIPTTTMANENTKPLPLMTFTYIQNRSGNIIQEFNDGSWKVYNVKSNKFTCGLNNYNIDLEQEQYTFNNPNEMNAFYNINYQKDFIPFELF